ncbi:sigma-70 family RNA polymerase sigma factor [Enterocloster clostridioformis]|uniref:sigma-70 family RNA polymerase sigma factor n=1 Tax=Enterocloster clostridioformis TaxID=1531 RepID=UPI00080C7776|nr:sigma-70 family RNA polymerase sigma factor [Enterocloster clostridioformis]ANU48723.1 RNA polymerase subunit sigma-24 [Lachnoclostridium sp. YL32]NDO31995.1 sigma-70 family RNA polymerase sigma factor [Enterocloster clostridioformis]OXE63860.1 sigma-70 family RNA polymerase sigma factor [Enterocloster clostridioformis]QQR02378.1 sigma-70 family RNA polymerase sigma factor [Enterocloster clostridioformis]
MKTSNLRKYYYPYYTEDVFVEVSDEVAEAMLLSVREMENYYRRTCRHKAYYSLDAYDWTENYALEHSPSPEEVLVLQEEQAARDRLLSMLDEALSQITPVQARRGRSYYLRGLNFPGIAQEEGINKDVVCRSVHAGLKRLQEYYSRRNRVE